MKDSRKKIVMVDDAITNLNIGKNALIDKYDIFTVPSGKKLFELLEKTTPDLILLDVEMPEMNGYEVIKILKSREDTAHIPVVFLTAMSDPGSELEGLSLGAIDYISKPFSAPLLLKRIEVHLLVESQKNELKNYNDNLEQMVKEKTKTVFELQNAVLKTVAELVECRDDVTGGHIERTQGYLRLLVDALLNHEDYREEVSKWDIVFFILSAQLHDVGKIVIKDSILLKPAKLTDEEFEEMKTHTSFGVEIIKKIGERTTENDFLKYAEILAGSHHERWDGTGYPLGLKGEEISLQGRLMAIVDVYDALTNDRPYKRAFSHEEAVKIIESESGTHFDPRLVEIFMENQENFKNLDVYSGDFSKTAQEKTKDVYGLEDAFSKAVTEILDYRSGTSIGHIERIQGYITILADALLKHERYKKEVSTWDWDTGLFVLSAQLHDVGKMSIKDSILQKPSRLTDDEFAQIKTHTDFGVKVVKKIGNIADEDTFLKHAEAFTGSHHEKWDGTGYPLGLSGEDIPLQGRLMAIIDTYNTLTNDRPNKKTLSHKEAVEVIKNDSGTYFDPCLVDIFLEHEKEFADLTSRYEQQVEKSS